MEIISIPLGALLKLCYGLLQNYGLALILFTLLTKVVLFPVSLWVHTNGIKMVRMQTAINRLRIQYFGDEDRIADEQTKLYKKEKYNPFSGLVPIAVQLVLLIGLIQVIYHPLTYILGMDQSLAQAVIALAAQAGGIDAASGSAELLALNFMQHAGDMTAFAALEGIDAVMLASMQGMHMNFLSVNLAGVPMTDGGVLLLVPILAGLASVVLSLSQNVLNPLQREQGKAGQLGSMAFSVGLSLVLGFMVPAGVGFYWVLSNLLTIAQQVVLNMVYRPHKHIDYAELEASKKELAEYKNVGKQSGKRSRELIHREKTDYKRFFSIVNKHLVFYSEQSGFYKYYQGIIEFLLENSNIIIHYVTIDPDDQIFEIAIVHLRIKPYYIGEKRLITLMMKMNTDIVVMTMPELDKYHIKRSYVRKDVQYIYVFHGLGSVNTELRSGALDHYDTVYIVNEQGKKEIRAIEKLYGLPEKRLVECGYPLLDRMREDYKNSVHEAHAVKRIMIAPSWQPENIMESCIEEILKGLLGRGYHITLRPHPQYMRHHAVQVSALKERYRDFQNELTIEDNFVSSSSVYSSDLLITDWSNIGYEFCFTTFKPVLFIHTPMKTMNPDYKKIQIVSFGERLRSKVGYDLYPDKLDEIGMRAQELLDHMENYSQRIRQISHEERYHYGTAARVAALDILEQLTTKKKKAE